MPDGLTGEGWAGRSKSFLGEYKLKHDLNAMATKLGLSKALIRRARSVYVETASMRFSRSVPERTLVAAALYVACREFRKAITLRDFVAWGCSLRDVGRCYSAILDRMDISRPEINGSAYLHHLTLSREPSGETYMASEEIIRRSTSAGLGGRNPMTLAAAALYIASCSNGEKITQDEVAEAAGVGIDAIRECCREIRGLGGSLQAGTTADLPQGEFGMEVKRCNGFGD